MESTYYNTKLDEIFKLVQVLTKDATRADQAAVAGGSDPRGKPIKRKVLWVDDHPKNNAALIDLFRPQGVEFDLALNTNQALDRLANGDYGLIISDMGRDRESDAGIKMIREIDRRFGSGPPVLIYCSSGAVQRYGDAAKKAGAALVTDNPRDLIAKMTSALGLQTGVS